MGIGDYLWRGGERIEVEREPEAFTVLAPESSIVPATISLPGVQSVDQLLSAVAEVKVQDIDRDITMHHVRMSGLVCHHVYGPSACKGTRYFLTDRISVKFYRDPGCAAVEQQMSLFGLALIRPLSYLPRVYLFRVTDAAGMNPVKVCNRLMADVPSVEWAEVDILLRYIKNYTPQDTLYSNQWHLKNSGGVGAIAGADIAAEGAWDITRGIRRVSIAIIDDGFDLEHPDLVGANKVHHAYDFKDDDLDPSPSSAAGDYHGTAVAGVALAEEDFAGVIGVAPWCAFVPIRFPFAWATDTLIANAISYAGGVADVINNSWGPVPGYYPLSSVVSEALNSVHATGGTAGRGCSIVFAAGNSAAPLIDHSNTSFTFFISGIAYTVTGPILNGFAASSATIVVGASTSENLHAAYSNFSHINPQNKLLDVVAPSSNFDPATSMPLPGLKIWTTDNEAKGLGFTPGSQYTGEFGGTSAAAPQVAGVIALLLSANRGLVPAQIREILHSTADKIVDPSDPRGSYQDGYSIWFGWGKVNAAAALNAVKNAADGTTSPTPQPRLDPFEVPQRAPHFSRGRKKHFTHQIYPVDSAYYISATAAFTGSRGSEAFEEEETLGRWLRDGSPGAVSWVTGDSQQVSVQGLPCEPLECRIMDPQGIVVGWDDDCCKELLRCISMMGLPRASMILGYTFPNFPTNIYHVWIAGNHTSSEVNAWWYAETADKIIPNSGADFTKPEEASDFSSWHYAKTAPLMGPNSLFRGSSFSLIFCDPHGWPYDKHCEMIKEHPRDFCTKHSHSGIVSVMGIYLTTSRRPPSIPVSALSGTDKEIWAIESIPADEVDGELYLTGGRNDSEFDQTVPWHSLGGWPSRTPLASGVPNNLFSYVTERRRQEGGSDYACVAFANNSQQSWMHRLKITLSTGVSNADIRISGYFDMRYANTLEFGPTDLLPSPTDAPPNTVGAFKQLDTQRGLTQEVTAFRPGGILYIWIKREVVAGAESAVEHKLRITISWNLGRPTQYYPGTNIERILGLPPYKVFNVVWTYGPSDGQDIMPLDLAIASASTESAKMSLSIRTDSHLDANLDLAISQFHQSSISKIVSNLASVLTQEV